MRCSLFNSIFAIALSCFIFFASPVAYSNSVVGREAAFGKVVVQLRWLHQFQFAGYYAALDKGFYRDAGLDVVLSEGGPGRLPVDEVLSGRAQYGAGNSEVLNRRLHGDPLVALAAIFQHSPSVLIATAKSGIRTPHDLIGKSVMLMQGQHDSDFYAMLLHEGIKPELVNIVPTSYDINDLATNKVDAFNSYLTNEPYFLDQAGIAYNVINPSQYGIDYYGDIVFTTERELTEHPDRVRAFREATLKGWRYAMENPKEIIDLLLTKYKVNKSRSHLEYEASAMRALVSPELVEIGHMNPWRWSSMATAFKEVGMVPADASLDGFIYDQRIDAERADMGKKITFLIWSVSGALAVVLIGGVVVFKLRKEIKRRKAIEEELIRSTQLLRRTNEVAKIGGWERDIDKDIVYLSDMAAKIRELPIGSQLSGAETLSYYAPEERAARRAEVNRAIQYGLPWEHESLITLPSGKQVWIHSRGEVVKNNGKVVKLVGAMQDITDRKMAELSLLWQKQELEIHNEILSRLGLSASLEEILVTAARKIEHLHPDYLCVLRVTQFAEGGASLFVAPSLTVDFANTLDDAISFGALPEGGAVPCASIMLAPEARSTIANVSADSLVYQNLVRKEGGQVARIILLHRQTLTSLQPPLTQEILVGYSNLLLLVIERYVAEEQIKGLAFYDALTGLPNRRLLEERLSFAFAAGRRSKLLGALMFIDLDNFKPLNDRYGHPVGDQLLKQVAMRLKGCVRGVDTVARFGGDEFVVVIGELHAHYNESKTQASLVADKINRVLAEPYELEIDIAGGGGVKFNHQCTASIGVVLFSADELTTSELLKQADIAMYRAKEKGRNCTVYFN